MKQEASSCAFITPAPRAPEKPDSNRNISFRRMAATFSFSMAIKWKLKNKLKRQSRDRSSCKIPSNILYRKECKAHIVSFENGESFRFTRDSHLWNVDRPLCTSGRTFLSFIIWFYVSKQLFFSPPFSIPGTVLFSSLSVSIDWMRATP